MPYADIPERNVMYVWETVLLIIRLSSRGRTRSPTLRMKIAERCRFVVYAVVVQPHRPYTRSSMAVTATTTPTSFLGIEAENGSRSNKQGGWN